MMWDCRRCTENFWLGIGKGAAVTSYAGTAGCGKLAMVR
ncbi:hypothetical protein SeJ_A1396 [Salmonella enterica subsp. enterica serovar Javiana str. GA_MM04042433]|nr:hypothetical protein SeJ_A1396 [Salmonella enterica subsp. enterica serovar Javiana str. GA_MM04042433]